MSQAKKKKTDGPSFDDEIPIWEFIYDNVCNLELQEEVSAELFRQYRDENPTVPWTVQQLLDYFNHNMLSTLYKCDLPGYKILSLYKALEIEMSHHTETMLEPRFSAVLRVNADRILEQYSFFAPAKQSVLHTIPKPSDVVQKTDRGHEPAIVVPEECETEVWKYINFHSSEVTGDAIKSQEFWENMIKCSPNLQVKSPLGLLHHFKNKMIGKLFRQSLSPNLKLRLYKDLRVEINTIEKEWFLKHEGLQLHVSVDGILEDWTTVDRIMENRWDGNMRDGNIAPLPVPRLSAPGQNISAWIPRASNVPQMSSNSPQTRFSPPTVPLDIEQRPPSRETCELNPGSETMNSHREKRKRVPFFALDQIKAWKHVHDKIKCAVKHDFNPVLPKGKVFWEEYVRKENSPKTASNWSSHFRKQMCPALQEMPFKREKMLFLFKHIDIEVDERVHKILEKKCNAIIKLTSSRNVVSWKFLDEHEEERDRREDNSEYPEEENVVRDDDASSSHTTVPLGSEELIMQDQDKGETNDHEGVIIINTELYDSSLHTNQHDAVSGSDDLLLVPLQGAENKRADKSTVEADEIIQNSYFELQNTPGTSKESLVPRGTTSIPLNKPKELLMMRIQTGSRKRNQTFDEDEPNDCITKLFKVKNLPENSKRVDSTERVGCDNSENLTGNSDEQERCVRAEVLCAVQQAINCFGDDVIDRMEESVKIAFEKKTPDEVIINSDGIKELVVETVENSELDEDEKRRILLHVDILTTKLLKSIGIIENRTVSELDVGILKKSLEAKLSEITKKGAKKPLTSDE